MTSSSTQLFPLNLDRLTDKERHSYILNQYVLNRASESRKHKHDIDIIRENHRFLWDDEEVDAGTLGWEQRLALRYYRKLFKEYCIVDLTRFKENKIALRWRTEQEVISGIGQFQCGSRHCDERSTLRTWEVNFKYIEQGAPLNALVKLRLCTVHSEQLNYRTKKRELKRQKRRDKAERKSETKHNKKRKQDKSPSSEEEDDQQEQPHTVISDDTSTVISDAPRNETEDEQIWSKQLDRSQEQQSREQEFERYLEDLFL